MACQCCRSQARSLVQAAVGATQRAPAHWSRSTMTTTATMGWRSLATQQRNGNRIWRSRDGHPSQTRQFSQSSGRLMLQAFGNTALKQPYLVVAAAERLYKVCGSAANYHITPAERKKDEVQKLEDGEEVGHSTAKSPVWHETFKLPPTFSTWSHVTMLHLYLLNARVRCFERDTYQRWQQQLVDQFFFDAEKKMHVEHGITSSALRQRYLKDIFVQWRGLLLAYDEGLAKGDAILASAVWRNLFKGDPEVDPRALATIVGWMRASLKALETTSDFTFPTRAKEILEVPLEGIWKSLQTSIGPQVEASKVKKPVEPQARAQVNAQAAAAARASS